MDAKTATRKASPSPVIDAALRRLAREGRAPASPKTPPAQAQRALAAARRSVPVLTLEPPRAPADPRALAALLAEDAARRLDQLCYLWEVVQELEPFARPGEGSLRRRAAELLLAAAGGDFEVPLEGPLRAVRSFLRAHGMHEEYVESLCAWYLDGERAGRGR
jgi:hypothetical protein